MCGRTSRGHTGGRSHKISPPSFCGACLNFLLREGFSRLSPSSTVKLNFVYPQINRFLLVGYLFIFCEEKSLRVQRKRKVFAVCIHSST